MIMKLSNEGLRKAAVLVSSLDTDAADAVLDQLSPQQAQQVRDLLMEMGDVDQGEQRRVMDEFFQGRNPAMARGGSSGVELDGRLAWLASRGAPMDVPEAHSAEAEPKSAFRFLQETEAEKLARLLAGERPQTIALVLSHLPHARAGAVLSRLPDAVQVEVIQRLVDLEEADPAILKEVETALQARLSQEVRIQRRRVAGIQAVAGILKATEAQAGMQILDKLAAHDRKLAERLGPRSLEFDDLADLDDQVLTEVFAAAGPELLLPALFGAAPSLLNRMLSRLPPADARAIRWKLDHPGPIRLSDVEEARRQVARIATRLNYQVTHTVMRAA